MIKKVIKEVYSPNGKPMTVGEYLKMNKIAKHLCWDFAEALDNDYAVYHSSKLFFNKMKEPQWLV